MKLTLNDIGTPDFPHYFVIANLYNAAGKVINDYVVAAFDTEIHAGIFIQNAYHPEYVIKHNIRIRKQGR